MALSVLSMPLRGSVREMIDLNTDDVNTYG